MTPQEFADAHGLTLEEAHLILEKRNRPAADPNSRLALAREALEKTQKRVGVQPVSAEGEELVQVYDPDADVGVKTFYEKQGPQESTWAQFGRGGQKPNPGDWEEPP